MSTSDVVISPEFAPSRVGRLLRSELSLVFKRRRNIALLVALACAPLLIGIAVEVAAPSEGGEGPPFLSLIAQNGLFLAFTALVVSLPLFMPLAVSVVSGESVAGEASIGTLRYVLTVPVSRLRLLLVKYAAIAAYALVAALVVAGVGILVGSLLFPYRPGAAAVGGRAAVFNGAGAGAARRLVRGSDACRRRRDRAVHLDAH